MVFACKNKNVYFHMVRMSKNCCLTVYAAFARLGARCLSAVSAYDNTLEIVDTLDTAQAKFDDILNSPSMDIACEKIKSLAKSKELDSSLILLINSAWASAKESTTMRNEVWTLVTRKCFIPTVSMVSVIILNSRRMIAGEGHNVSPIQGHTEKFKKYGSKRNQVTEVFIEHH